MRAPDFVSPQEACPVPPGAARAAPALPPRSVLDGWLSVTSLPYSLSLRLKCVLKKSVLLVEFLQRKMSLLQCLACVFQVALWRNQV